MKSKEQVLARILCCDVRKVKNAGENDFVTIHEALQAMEEYKNQPKEKEFKTLDDVE